MRTEQRALLGTAAPWWLDAIYRIGVPAALALFLVWFLTQKVSGQLDTVTSALQTHATVQERERSEMKFYLRAICVNVAADDRQRAACNPPAAP
jgi:hypothetical protein